MDAGRGIGIASLALALLLPTAANAGGDDVTGLAIDYQSYTLDNGLQVLLSEDHDIPVVRVEVWYHVGSKDEVEGRSGFAHLFEHLMFQGSEHANADYFVPLQEIGASVNGSTNLDRTNYYEQLSSEYLPLALWMEADRMGWLLPVLDEERLRNQKDVVRNERRQNYENRPYGNVWITLLENLFPPGHPYHHSTIGSHEDIEAASLDDVHGFFRTYYAPNNATLTVVGDFDPAVAKDWVERTFGQVSRGEEAPAVTVPRFRRTDQTVIRQQQDVPLHKVWIAWPTPALFAPGDAELDLLSKILTDGKESRLYSALVHEQQIAKDVRAYQRSQQYAGAYVIQATAADGHTTDELVAAIDAILAELAAQAPSVDEVEVARIQYERTFVTSLGTLSGRSVQLHSYNHHAGTPDYLQRDIARYRKVNGKGIRKAVKKLLPLDRRVVLHVVPAAGDDGEGE
jgi:zinc protease